MKTLQPIPVTYTTPISALLPPMKDIPEEYRKFPGYTTWHKVISQWFFGGIKTSVFVPKPGIDKMLALAHVAAIMRSWEPKHEHKESGCAYLCSLWFEEPKEW